MYDPSGDDAPRKLQSPGTLEDGGKSGDGTQTAETRERLESVAVLEGMPTISYQPFSDDEDSEDDLSDGDVALGRIDENGAMNGSFSEEELGSPVKRLVNGVTEKASTLSLKSGLNASAPAFVPPSAKG